MSYLRKSFYVSVYEDGDRSIVMHIDPPIYGHLSGLTVGGYYDKASPVLEELNELRKVASGEKEVYAFGTEWCFITAKKDFSTIENTFNYYEPFTCPTEEILLLMEEWFDFLTTYENGQIPGLSYPPPPRKIKGA